MKINKARLALAGSMYLLLAFLMAAAYLIYSSPASIEGASPFTTAGPATTAFSGVVTTVAGSGAQWPSWVTSTDRDNFDRVMKNVREGESRKFMTSMMVFQDDLEERGHGVLELKGPVISNVAGEVVATSMTPVIFAMALTVGLVLLSSILSRSGANPLDKLEGLVSIMMGIAGVWFLRVSALFALTALFTVSGIWMRGAPGLLYGVTEGSTWLMGALFTVWLAALMGLGNAPKPKTKKCPQCGGSGRLPDAGNANGPETMMELGEDGGGGETLQMNA